MASLNNQVGELGLKDRLGKQNFHENVKNIYGPLTNTTKTISQKLTKPNAETFTKNNHGLEKF